MKKRINLYLLLLISSLIAILIVLKIGNVFISQDLYQINSDFYLKKVDYFSKYEIAKKNIDDYQIVISNVSGLYEFPKGCIAEYSNNSRRKYLYILFETGKYKNYDNLEKLSRDIDLEKIKWKKPWQVVELKTLNSPKRLINQILLITIIVLVFYLIMRIFNLKKLIKAHNNIYKK